ncbi:regulator of nonsense transcripts 3B-like isoform X2 [Uloborus diversus]|uniref:regulator of nonsense transcripts 3B-like isoform X2 n=1 Tax=Uloborus diversus TaxID=327109 RepID=UPI002409AF65|nr:regulator of nonsense transcripts 3B-like isoform X2 [Uloborus diversus]
MSLDNCRSREISSSRGKQQANDYFKGKMKRDKAYQTKVVIRRLPPLMTEDQFVEQISPIPEHDYMYFVKADMSLGSHGFSRAYINFLIPEDIFIFKDKFDGYVFLDNKGNEYPAIVEFSPFQKIPKKRNKKRDAKCGTIANDPDYLKFLEGLKNPDDVTLPSAEAYLEEIESREKELKANNGVPKATTPLIEYLKARKIEQQKIREEKREERKRKEIEKKRVREEERRRRKAEKDKERVKEKYKDKESLSEKETGDDIEESPVSENFKQSETVVQVLKNPERERDQKEQPPPPKQKDCFVSSRFSKDKDRGLKKEWERIRPKERQKVPERVTYVRDKDRSRRDKSDYKLYVNKKSDSDSSARKSKEDFKDIESSAQETSESSKEKKVHNDDEEKEAKSTKPSAFSQWSPKDKRDNSCPGEENTETNDKSDSSSIDYRDQSKDPRVERRIRNKDRPSLEIYRPGMRRFSAQRSSPQKEISTSASNSSSPSPTPPLTVGAVKTQNKEDSKNANAQNA